MTPTSTEPDGAAGADDADDAWAAWAARTPAPTEVAAESTEIPRPAPPARRTRVTAETSFRRFLVGTIVVLALLCAGFVVVSQQQGPKLDQTQVDTTAVTQDPGQQARLFVATAVSHVARSQVTVTPDVPFTVQTVGTVVAVQFTDRLAYSTRYTIRVDGVTSVDGSRASTLTTHFTTASASVLALVRNPGGVDQIVRADLRSPGRPVVYRARGIQAFGQVGDDLVVVTEQAGLSTISLVARSDGTTEKLVLPGAGTVTSFAVDPPTGVVVFGWTAAGAGGTPRRPGATTPLYTIPLSGNHLATRLLGPGHRPVSATSWFMTAGAPVVVARVAGGDVERVDLSLGGRASAVSDPAPSVSARLNGEAGASVVGGAARIEGGRVVVQGRSLYAPIAGTRVVAVEASPNGEFAVVVTAPASSPADGYTIDPVPVSPTTLVVDARSGAVVASLSGAHLDW
ncbi:hypothetical protein [Frondihabitans australicus]|uniref:SbsA Ig-like domain-containing protein n=1 Tax=Frondihabitans australicus TaxID=386892 RepID=A0A495IE35_9MICO|nr:hypothetical protein [Frondihabitans australicus]RKR74257.1 hypothetical protein C8E83_1366 [Frondihabitans australicus]